MSTSNVFGEDTTTENNNTIEVETVYFKIQLPYDWIYKDRYFFYPSIEATLPQFFENVFGSQNSSTTNYVAISFEKDYHYEFKNVPVEIYANDAKRQILEHSNITKQENTSIGGEKAICLHFQPPNIDIDLMLFQKVIFCLVVYDREPFRLGYLADNNNFDKYLPQFEQIRDSFEFK